MSAPGTIGRAPETAPGADYATLRAKAIALVQAMSGDVWTDYNFSDPGVTIIEQLCYALTEMPFRAGFPVGDLLCAPGEDAPRLRRHGLLLAAEALPCNPVTASDFRRIVLDRVAGVANIWFVPRDTDAQPGCGGLYDIMVLPLPDVPEPERLLSQVRRCYTARRALCEDVASITLLRPLATTVHARIEISDAADPSDTLADTLFALGLALAPEPARLSLAEKRALDPATATVFAGPLMLRGFIADDQLKPLPDSFTADQLVELLAGVEGVLTIDRLSVELEGHERNFTGTKAIPVPAGQVLALQTRPVDGRFSIVMARNHVRCPPDPGRVRRRLADHWTRQRQTHGLRADYARRYGVPAAQHRDFAAYLSVQEQFPRVYGIGRNGLPSGAPAARLARAKQLKAYLMAFDQMLADGFSQLGAVRGLFSVEAGGAHTYAWQSLRGIVPDAERMGLFMPGYDEGMADLVAQTDPVDARRNAILDMLLSFQALALASPDEAAADPLAMHKRAEALIAAKQALLRRSARATRDRGRGVDYLRPNACRWMAGAELLCGIELDLLDGATGDYRPRRPSADQAGPQLVDDPALASFGHVLPPHLWMAVERQFQPVEADEEGEPVRDEEALFLAGERIAESLLEGLRDPERYRIGVVGETEALVLVCNDRDGRWWLLAEFDSEDEARRVLLALLRAARAVRRRSPARPFYLVDWVLLRHAAPDAASAAHYGFRVTAVLAQAPEEAVDGPGWMSRAQAIVRANVPAHVALDCLFLEAREMDAFAWLHGDWTQALRDGPPAALAATSRRLERFLKEHLPSPPPDDPQDPPGPAPDDPPSPPPPPPTPTPSPTPTPAPGPTPTPAPAPSPPPAPTPTPAPAPPPDPGEPGEEPPTPAHRGLIRFLLWFIGLLSSIFLWWRRARDHVESPAEPPPAPALPPLPLPPASVPPPEPSGPASDPPPPDPSGAGHDAADPAVQPAQPGAQGFDTDGILSASSAAAFRAAGFRFALRYLSRAAPGSPRDLTAHEAATIRAAGLALMAVQHVAPAGWAPSEALGADYGRAAARNAQAAGLLPGVTLWLDLEGVAHGTAAAQTIAYCRAWFAAVAQAGYRSGLYVGADCGLSGDQLGALDCACYWRSGSHVPVVTGHGYAMVQTMGPSSGRGFSLAGIAYDRDRMSADGQAELPWWYAPETGEGAA